MGGMPSIPPRGNLLRPRQILPLRGPTTTINPATTTPNGLRLLIPPRKLRPSPIPRSPPPPHPSLRPHRLGHGPPKLPLPPRPNHAHRPRNNLQSSRVSLHKPRPVPAPRRPRNRLVVVRPPRGPRRRREPPHPPALRHPRAGPALQMPYLADFHRWR